MRLITGHKSIVPVANVVAMLHYCSIEGRRPSPLLSPPSPLLLLRNILCTHDVDRLFADGRAAE